MSKSKAIKEAVSTLRQKAEKKLSPTGNIKYFSTANEFEHELNVHKVELELQNDELKLTQSRLEKTLENYADLFEYAPVGYFILNESGVILNVNNASLTLLNVTKKKLLKKPFSIFLNGTDYQDEFYRYRLRVMETGEKQETESAILRPDGSSFPALISSSIIKNEDGQFKYFLAMVNDISIRKELEEQVLNTLAKEKELNQLKSSFLATASHEFSTPLAAILFSAELLEMSQNVVDMKKNKKLYDSIKFSIEELTEILRDFLSINKYENGLFQNNPEQIKLREFTAHIIEELNIKNLPIVYNHTGQTKQVLLDKQLLKVCLRNIISNAIKYSKENQVINIDTNTTDPKIVKFCIQDHGMGIADNEKPLIFKQFYRTKKAAAFRGTGLGLNIVQKFVSVMNGSISFTSKVNKGSTFNLSFPSGI